MAYIIFWEENGIYIRHSGIVTYHEIIEIEGRLVGDVRYETSRYEIIDILHVEDFRVSPNEMAAIGSLEKAASRYRREKQIIVLLNNEAYKPVIDKYFEVLSATGWETILLKSLHEARRFIAENPGSH
ncbi:MAG: hypothetical protein JXA03_07515 [Bacteroidales bacterium]|nr:hypothetical protein [Bacteroidales bacterium]